MTKPKVYIALDFPTAAAAVFRLDDAGKAHFERLFVPREHGGGAV